MVTYGKNMFLAFHACDRGSNPLGDATILAGRVFDEKYAPFPFGEL